MLYTMQLHPAYGEWAPITHDKFAELVGYLQPIHVQTEAEALYLEALKLMIGRDFLLFVEGQPNPTDLPATHMKIDLPLQ